jgi:glycerophosphoryl diester phosphodiesterase
MKFWLSRIAFALALVVLGVFVINASWLAPTPRGQVKLIAHRGVAQEFDRKGVTNDSCTATRIERPVHDYLDNTVRSIAAARDQGAHMIEMDVAPTADGNIAIFHDWTLACRTDGHGEVRSKTLDELKRLDIGYGYTADGGRTFPFRGLRRDRIPSLAEAVALLPVTPILFNFKGKDPAEADLLAKALKAAGRDPQAVGDGFYGAEGPVERIRQLYPRAWAWSLEGAKRCTIDYLKTGWTTIFPESCRGGTMIVPLNRQWLFWGWPDRLLQRMTDPGGRVIITGPYRNGEPNTGLTLPEQLGSIPSTFTGYVWVEDIWTIGPALQPRWDIRSPAQVNAAEAGLERRRARK